MAAPYHGRDGLIMAGAEGAGGTNAIAKVYDWTMETERPTEDATAMLDEDQDSVDGIPGHTGSASARYDDADTLGQEFIADNAIVDLKLYMIGSGTGKPFVQMTAIITNLRYGGNYQGVVDFAFDFKVKKAVTKGVDP